MKIRIALALLASACVQPPADIQETTDDNGTHPIAVPDLASSMMVPECISGVWAYQFTFGAGSCNVDPFVSDIEAVDCGCFEHPIGPETLFGTSGTFEIKADGTVDGVPAITSVDGCNFTLDYVHAPIYNACGQVLNEEWHFAKTSDGSGPNQITLTIDNNGAPYTACAQAVSRIVASKL